MLEVKSPWDGELIESLKHNNESEIENILESASVISKNKGSDFPIVERIEVLKNFYQKIKKNITKLSKLAAFEGGKPLKDSIIEINRGADGVESCIEILKSEHGQVIPMNLDEASNNRIAFTQKEPIGLVLAISAFNHPFNLIIHQIIPAIATGCVVIVKPAEDTPLSCIEIVNMLYESGLPKKRCKFILPESIALATKVVADKRIDFFSFIGSSKVGWYLRTKISPGTRCALEHGGMAPTFLSESSTLDLSAKSLSRGGFYHSGQVCVSVQKIFVQKKILDDFIEIFKSEVKKLIIGNPLSEKSDLGPLIREKEVVRVGKWVSESIKNGAKLIAGGKKISNTTFDKTIILNPNPEDDISKNEIFGPVVCLYDYENMNDAIEIANSSDMSFQASIFSDKIDEILNFYSKINASSVFHNDHTAFRVDWMPFAGLKSSGHGTGGIKYTMDDMQVDKMLILRKKG